MITALENGKGAPLHFSGNLVFSTREKGSQAINGLSSVHVVCLGLAYASINVGIAVSCTGLNHRGKDALWSVGDYGHGMALDQQLLCDCYHACCMSETMARAVIGKVRRHSGCPVEHSPICEREDFGRLGRAQRSRFVGVKWHWDWREVKCRRGRWRGKDCSDIGVYICMYENNKHRNVAKGPGQEPPAGRSTAATHLAVGETRKDLATQLMMMM